jgi:hypothetical protein
MVSIILPSRRSACKKFPIKLEPFGVEFSLKAPKAKGMQAMTRGNSRREGMTTYIFEKHQRLLGLMKAAMTKRPIPALMDPPTERPAGLQKDFSFYYGADGM